MVNACSGIYGSNMPVNSTAPVTDSIAKGESTVPSTNEMLPGTYCPEYYMMDCAYVGGTSAAQTAREISETQRKIKYLEAQVKRYPDNITYACQLDKARKRLQDLQKRV